MLFRELPAARPDPILSLAATFDADADPRKIDLGIGVYKDGDGRSTVLASVKRAEQWLLGHQESKAYLSSAGALDFNAALQKLLFGAHPAVAASRVATAQTVGGSGALRVASELIRQCRPTATVWVPRPSWANHIPILRASGLSYREYGYYDRAAAKLTFDTLLGDLQGVAPADIVLIHGCCHNPSGADLSAEQWRELTDLLVRRQAVPLLDIAYQGFADGVEEDAFGLRLLAQSVPEMLVASSCSKNFSLYRERTGSVSVIGADREATGRAAGALLNIIRPLYSMPPDHGAAVVACILATADLHQQWLAELEGMRVRIRSIRAELAKQLSAAAQADFSYLMSQNGMFSFLNLSPLQATRLRSEHHVHALDSGRINVAGLSAGNVAYVAQAVAAVLREGPMK